MIKSVIARRMEHIGGTVVERTPLQFEGGADVALDRPAHVRAGSGLAQVSGRLVIVQDDTSFLAVMHHGASSARGIPLPAGPGGARQFDDQRGNKKHKLDLEASMTLRSSVGDMLIAIGSGSSRLRERVVVALGLDTTSPLVIVQHLPEFYARLRATPAFSGSELNLEGVAPCGDGTVMLFQRGNGAPRGGFMPVNATVIVDEAALRSHILAPSMIPVPSLHEITQFDLGGSNGVPLTFTDACLDPHGRGIFYLAAAEASPDTTTDGPVAGVVLGLLTPDGAAVYGEIVHADGKPFLLKAEGLLIDPTSPDHAWIVLDLDDPNAPSELCRLDLHGHWPLTAAT